MYGRGVHGRGHAWQRRMNGTGRTWQERQPLQRKVRILLECILVALKFETLNFS